MSEHSFRNLAKISPMVSTDCWWAYQSPFYFQITPKPMSERGSDGDTNPNISESRVEASSEKVKARPATLLRGVFYNRLPRSRAGGVVYCFMVK